MKPQMNYLQAFATDFSTDHLTKTGNEIFKISCTGNGPEIEIFVNLGDIFRI